MIVRMSRPPHTGTGGVPLPPGTGFGGGGWGEWEKWQEPRVLPYLLLFQILWVRKARTDGRGGVCGGIGVRLG